MLTSQFTYLSDSQWDAIAPLFPGPKNHVGRPATNPRRIIDAILCVLIEHIPYKDLPSHFPPPTTVNTRYCNWKSSGMWDAIRNAIFREFASRTGLDLPFLQQKDLPLSAVGTEILGNIHGTIQSSDLWVILLFFMHSAERNTSTHQQKLINAKNVFSFETNNE